MLSTLCKIFVIFLLFIIEIHSQAPPAACPCVPINTCYQNITSDGSGVIDIRIVNTGNPTVPPTNPPPIVTPTTAPPACAAGTEQCCVGVTGCGVRWNIPQTAAITPAAGQARYGSQPWAAVILGIDNTFIGGGVLLDTINVLTVAHKVVNRTPATIKVRLGEWDTSRIIESYAIQESLVTQIRMHAQYIAANLTNDIAILRLATHMQLGPNPNPAINTGCVPPATLVPDNMRCVVAGWGQNAFNGPFQAILKEVDVPILTNADCLTRLRATRLGPAYNLDTTNFLCAGGEVGRDACVGDGGSGLMCNVGGKYQLVGLVAWGIGCATANVPGVYVRVQSFLTWIAQNQI